MSLFLITLITVATFLTAILSGVFGMAGGIIMMALLLGLLPVASAMVLHAAIQLVSNGWRCFLWRRHIVWRVTPFYGLGIAAGVTAISFVHYVPDKALALIVVGAVPLLALAAQRLITLSILNPTQTFLTAMVLTFIQMTGGVVGPLLDLLYNNAPLTRQEIVSTKAMTQSVMHTVRLAYFGSLIPLLTGREGWPEGLDPVWMLVFMAAAISGTTAAAPILQRINDRHFKELSRALIVLISFYCLARGLSMLLL
ncbi:MAG: sulfite exporter TauE/SafE family protein [Micavibrio aeruginosavorus]|uniref:Probable membrane transporter protein n=1 Tax=Micavibrio aeruginosavorus TaxID=349221 RepID=A0A7T5UHH8_9BACT|nr:MAG: sulfite exporter TauE/SafE family protein [Micavibrio aeruginosavorus]